MKDNHPRLGNESGNRSELERMVARLLVQQRAIEQAARAIVDVRGPVLELGLGKGRTYDHLRHTFPDRRIVVFDRDVHAPAHCVPNPEDLVLGEFSEILPTWLARSSQRIALVHADVGSRDPQLDQRLTRWLSTQLTDALAPGGWVLSDLPLNVPGLVAEDLCASGYEWPYYAFRAAPASAAST